jgi:hypothetical protein
MDGRVFVTFVRLVVKFSAFGHAQIGTANAVWILDVS